MKLCKILDFKKKMKLWSQVANSTPPTHKTRYIFFSLYSFFWVLFFIFFASLSFFSIPLLLLRSWIGSLLYFQFFEEDKIWDNTKIEMKPSIKITLALTAVLLIFFLKNPLIWLVPVIVVIMFFSYKNSLDLYKNRRYFNPREYINAPSSLIGLLVAAILWWICFVRFDKIDINCNDLNKSFVKILAWKSQTLQPEKKQQILAGWSLFFWNFWSWNISNSSILSWENSNILNWSSLTGQTLQVNVNLSWTRALIDKIIPTIQKTNPFYNSVESLKTGLATTLNQNKNLSSWVCKSTLENLKTNYENPSIRAFVMVWLSLLVLPFAKLIVMILNWFFTLIFYIFLKLKIFKKRIETTDRETIYW